MAKKTPQFAGTEEDTASTETNAGRRETNMKRRKDYHEKQ